MLAAWGRAVHRLRWWLVAVSLLPLTLWLGVPSGERLDESVVPPDMEAVRAVRLLDAELAPRSPSFGLIFSSATLRADDPRFVDAVQRALAPLRRDPRVARIRTPWDAPVPDARGTSTDARSVVVTVEVHGRAPAFASMVVPSARTRSAVGRGSCQVAAAIWSLAWFGFARETMPRRARGQGRTDAPAACPESIGQK